MTSWFFVCFAAILTKIIAHRKQIESVVDIEMQCDMLFILSAICENDVHRKVNDMLFILRFHFVIDQQRHHTAILYILFLTGVVRRSRR